ncbi:MAG: DUF2271 domain-containing protein [Acidaminococcaceae bacterium]|nr:DUF2271 domain-containing protein [Acidaminococcaceae bacterium]
MVRKLITVIMLGVCVLFLGGCGNEKLSVKHTDKPLQKGVIALGKVDITFNYLKQGGFGSNQFAVWIEDSKGNYIKTLGVTKFVATKGYKTREMALANWVKIAKRTDMNAQQVEAITNATPSTGMQTYEWNCTDAKGKPVEAGEYRYVVEATRYMEDYDIFSGKILVGKKKVASRAEMKAVGDTEKNKSMLTDVQAEFTPFSK